MSGPVGVWDLYVEVGAGIALCGAVDDACSDAAVLWRFDPGRSYARAVDIWDGGEVVLRFPDIVDVVFCAFEGFAIVVVGGVFEVDWIEGLRPIYQYPGASCGYITQKREDTMSSELVSRPPVSLVIQVTLTTGTSLFTFATDPPLCRNLSLFFLSNMLVLTEKIASIHLDEIKSPAVHDARLTPKAAALEV